jgi:hypothetical protein
MSKKVQRIKLGNHQKGPPKPDFFKVVVDRKKLSQYLNTIQKEHWISAEDNIFSQGLLEEISVMFENFGTWRLDESSYEILRSSIWEWIK